ncbi:DNA-3-methyladenine glycosylase 2 family protein [Martelella alba]|uniref:DNA-3-methyladenine glycosylase II n=1 Tax=Martelella alba TaxID=2590451 RepID=A0A506UAW8_9HYPH|nr:DNA-3-methyladenine glycosylase [Martelella alba]TPW31060.1 DNA-3-methyladenine glycosylase 2 family protein [Martelella alba]
MAAIYNSKDIEAELSRLLALAPALAPVAARAGLLPPRRAPSGFAGMVGVVAGQLISKQAASAILARITAACGALTPQRFLSLSPAQRMALGLTRAKRETLENLALAIIEGRLDLAAIGAMESEEAMAALTKLKGIGPWSAEVYLMFSAGHGDIFPAGDLALRAALAHAFALPERPSIAAVRAMALGWAPYRSVAARLFWAYYAREMKRDVLPLG